MRGLNIGAIDVGNYMIIELEVFLDFGDFADEIERFFTRLEEFGLTALSHANRTASE